MAERSDTPTENAGDTLKHVEPITTQDQAAVAGSPSSSSSRKRNFSNTSETLATATGRLRSASQRILEANVPVGMWSATGTVVAQAPTPADIRRGSVGEGDKIRKTITKGYSGGQLGSEAVAEEKAINGHRSTRQTRDTDDDIAVATEDNDGFPSNIFGRPELENQSYVPGQRASVYNQRVPKLAIRRKDSPASEVFQDAVESQPATESTMTKETPVESFPETEQDSDLDDLDPKPKRRSKNIDMMLGRTPGKPDDSTETKSYESIAAIKPVPNEEGIYPNGYSFPQPKPWTTATRIGFMAFVRFTFTPLGFLIVLYGLNVVAWGGMLFLLLCNASPAMCRLGDGSYDCNNIDSPRRVWVEIDSQILNALFCVTGFGLIPWRFRDLFYWIKWRVGKKEDSLRKLAGYHNGWFRLPNSDRLPVRDFRKSILAEDLTNPALPLPLQKTPSSPLTGARAPATAFWKLDFVIWAFVWNTFLQAVLSGFMWGLNRYDRPSWSTGLFVAMACIVAACGGVIQFTEGKKIKKVEGVPLEVHQEYQDVEAGIMGKKA
ncbi:MAG: hypothetical protein GOMPHAMPRED_006985 [Gomphillus americanus]|uniref:Uncharacterized protein n=1 Tax=Gomphillus americanus TaxID=1940652 RepID=A0A8H3I7E3_9LECA|nr:MAG: hypothetical protein GOMPHAMPRED_006985 [Gomphillus americanus]